MGATAATAPRADAHAAVVGTSPERYGILASMPRQVQLRFSEAVDARPGSIRVLDVRGRQVDDGRVVHPDGDDQTLAVGLRPGRPAGSYLAGYRVVAGDGHVEAGAIIFSVGFRGALPSSSLLGRDGAGPVTRAAADVTRGLGLLAVAMLVGGATFVVAVWLPVLATAAGAQPSWAGAARRFDDAWWRLCEAAIVIGLTSGVLAIVLQAALVRGTSFWAALDPAATDEALRGRAGTAMGVGVLVWALLAAVARGIVRPRRARLLRLRPASLGAAGLALARVPRRWLAAAAVPLAVLTLLPTFAGHAGIAHPWLLMPAGALHVLAVAVWVGGVAMLLLAADTASRVLAPRDGAALRAAVTARFATIALGAVVLVGITGGVQAGVDVGSWAGLVDNRYGIVVLVKVALLAGLVALGAVHRRRVLPALRRGTVLHDGSSAARRRLNRTLSGELPLMIAAVAAGSLLVTLRPPSTPTFQPFTATSSLGPARMQLTVDPARPGVNRVDVYLLRPNGRPYERMRLRATLGLPARRVGPFPVTVTPQGPGHFVVDDALDLTPAGRWRVRLVGSTRAGRAYRKDVMVPVK